MFSVNEGDLRDQIADLNVAADKIGHVADRLRVALPLAVQLGLAFAQPWWEPSVTVNAIGGFMQYALHYLGLTEEKLVSLVRGGGSDSVLVARTRKAIGS